jgi:hypothetical protein
MAWVTAVEPISGHTYYWNTETNEIAWDLPPVEAEELRSAAGFTANASAASQGPQNQALLLAELRTELLTANNLTANRATGRVGAWLRYLQSHLKVHSVGELDSSAGS